MPDMNPQQVSNEELDIKFKQISDELDDIRETLSFIKDTIVKADSTITGVAEQVMPTLNELMKSPMLKMLGVGFGGKKS